MPRIFCFYSRILLLTCGLVCFGAAIPPVQAASVVKDSGYHLEAGKIIDGNLYVSGDQATIEGTVNGDVLAATQKVTISGLVTGSVLVMTGDLTISGEVRGSVRGLSATTTIPGRIGSDLTVTGDTLLIKKDAQVAGSVYYLGNTSTLLGTIQGETKQQLGTKQSNNSDYLYQLLKTFLSLGLVGALVYSMQPPRETEALWSLAYDTFLPCMLLGLITLIVGLPLGVLLGFSEVGRWVGLGILSSVGVLAILGLVDTGYFIARLTLFRVVHSAPKFTVGILLIGLLIGCILSTIPFVFIIPLAIFLAAIGARLLRVKYHINSANAALHD